MDETDLSQKMESLELPRIEGQNAANNRAKKERMKRKKAEGKKQAGLIEQTQEKKQAEKKNLSEDMEKEKAEKEAEEAEALKAIAEIHSWGNNDECAVEIKQALGKRLGMFATKPIKAGTKFLMEAPLVTSDQKWLAVEAACASLDAVVAQMYFWPLHGGCHCSQPPCQETPVMQRWDTNSFEILPSVVAASPDYKSYHGRITCIYAKASYMNHACDPNTTYKYTKELDLVFIATRDIPQGEEITHTYLGLELLGFPVSTRRQLILGQLKFNCMCSACINGLVRTVNTPLPSMSISDVEVRHLKRISVVGEKNQTRIRLASEWAVRVEEHWPVFIRFWRLAISQIILKENSSSRINTRFYRHTTSQIIRLHSRWLKHNASFMCHGSTVQIDDEVLATHLKRLEYRVSHHLKHTVDVLGDQEIVSVFSDLVADKEATYGQLCSYLCELYRVSEDPNASMSEDGLYKIDEQFAALFGSSR
jgi:hypothetical protein